MAMEKPDWVFGNEKDFDKFISQTKGEETIILSHTDLDGLAAAKIINEYVKASKIMFLNYPDLNEGLVSKLKSLKPKKLIISDLFFKDVRVIKMLERFCDILIIDHHTPNFDFNSSRTVHMNSQGFCAAYLSYYLFSKLKDISYFDWIVGCASIADVSYIKNKSFMNMIFKKYNDEFYVDSNGEIRKSGIFWDWQWGISLSLIAKQPDCKSVFDLIKKDFVIPEKLKDYIKNVQEEYDLSMKSFDTDKKLVNGRYIWEFYPKYNVSSFIINEVSFKEKDKTIITISCKNDICKLSARRQDGGEDLNILCAKLVEGFENANGGGHKKASGGNFPKKYLSEVKKRLEIL